METNLLKYNIVIRKEGNYFIADVPSLGISDFGKTVEEAKKNVKEAMQCQIEGLLKTGSEVPPPDTEDFYITPTEIKVQRGLKFAY